MLRDAIRHEVSNWSAVKTSKGIENESRSRLAPTSRPEPERRSLKATVWLRPSVTCAADDDDFREQAIAAVGYSAVVR